MSIEPGSCPPTVLHIPHASLAIPPEERPHFVVSDAELQRELLRMSDHFTNELFALPTDVARSVTFPISRLVLDPERFEDDAQEPMTARGMGVLYTHTSQRTPLRAPADPHRREALLRAYYRPHHARLTHAVDAALAEHGRCLVVDCHSFPSVAHPYEVDQGATRPDICLGTDAFHTPRALLTRAIALYRDAGYRVEVDRPFSGALVPAAPYGRDARVQALMVEVNRGIYMDEGTGERLGTFEETCGVLRDVLGRLVASP